MAQINIRNVNDTFYRRVKAAASLAGKSISQFVIDLLSAAVDGKRK